MDITEVQEILVNNNITVRQFFLDSAKFWCMINGENIIIDGPLNYHGMAPELKKDYDEYYNQDWTESGEEKMLGKIFDLVKNDDKIIKFCLSRLILPTAFDEFEQFEWQYDSDWILMEIETNIPYLKNYLLGLLGKDWDDDCSIELFDKIQIYKTFSNPKAAYKFLNDKEKMEELNKKYPPSLGYHASLDLENYQIIITHE